jgi:hypothetical protein
LQLPCLVFVTNLPVTVADILWLNQKKDQTRGDLSGQKWESSQEMRLQSFLCTDLNHIPVHIAIFRMARAEDRAHIRKKVL